MTLKAKRFSSTDPNNARPWEGKAHLLLFEHARIWEVYLDTNLGTDYLFGQAVVLDGEHIGYAVPHPGPYAGDPGGGDYETPTPTNPVSTQQLDPDGRGSRRGGRRAR